MALPTALLAHCAPTNVRGRKRPISIGTPPELIAGVQARSNTSTARTSAGAKIRLFDSIFALCRALILLFFFWHFAGAPVSRPRKALRTRLRPFLRFRHRVEQTCGRRPDVCTIARPQTAHAMFRVRAVARSEPRTTVNSLMSKFPLPAFAVTRARRFSFGGTPAQLVADEIEVHADDDLALAPSSICSSARTGTRNNRPILITGSSPRAAAS